MNEVDDGLRVIIAGGGTGGHVFPALAIAEEFVRRNTKTNVLFVGTKRGLEGRILRETEFKLRLIDIKGIRRKGLTGTVIGISKIPGSMLRSREIIRGFCPNIVVGVGGYASGPLVLMAYLMGIKTVIAEQNALPGITNRILGRFVNRVFLAFPENRGWFSPEKVRVTGNPVRWSFIDDERKVREKSARFTVLIFGGSQGASSINHAVIESLSYLKKIRERLKIIHQTGEKDLEEVSKSYRDHGINAEVLPFIHDMAEAYRTADLLICRAGATSIAEITAMGKAALFVPFPFAVGNHQVLNARMLVEAGAAEMITEKELSGKRLFEVIERFHRNPESIIEMEKRSKDLGNIKAASDIVDECLTLIEQ